MDERTISEYLLSNEVTKHRFIGVLSFQELPDYSDKVCGFYIVNTDTVEGSGKHWLVINKVNNGNIEFFDSLGKSPNTYSSHILKFLENSASSYSFSNKRIQGNSDLCGDYCIMFIYLRLTGLSYQDFLKLFSDDLNENDEMIDLNT